MRRDHAFRRIESMWHRGRWNHTEQDGRIADGVNGRRLYERRAHRRHGLTTILTMMTMGRARHRLAALHGLLGRRGSATVQCVHSESGSENCQTNWLG